MRVETVRFAHSESPVLGYKTTVIGIHEWKKSVKPCIGGTAKLWKIKRCKWKILTMINNIKQFILACSKDPNDQVETEGNPGLYVITESTLYFNDFTDSIHL